MAFIEYCDSRIGAGEIESKAGAIKLLFDKESNHENIDFSPEFIDDVGVHRLSPYETSPGEAKFTASGEYLG